MTIQGFLFDKLPYHPVCGMLSPTVRSHIPTGLDIEPSVIMFDTAKNVPISVHASNITTNNVTINPCALLCEVQQVSILTCNFPRKDQLLEAYDVITQVNLPRDELSGEQLQKIIRRSHLPFWSNVVLVRKKNGQLRICKYYRHLNSRTKKDNFALPRIDEILDTYWEYLNFCPRYEVRVLSDTNS